MKRNIVCTALAGLLAAGCGVDKDLEEGMEDAGETGEGEGGGDDTGSGSGTDGSGTGSGTSSDGTGESGTTGGDAERPAGVEVLVVLDNSNTMGLKQARFVQAFSVLQQRWEAENVPYRVAVTTTDNSNPWCGGASTPEAGRFVDSSCRTREDNFTGATGTENVYQAACTDLCGAGDLGLTTPWIERFADGTNNLGDVSLEEAARCLLPQGIDGCGFESPLESMYKAIARTQNTEDPAFGFLRQDTSLLVLIVTDEVDCSYNTDWEAIFTQDGGRVFWGDPDALFPTSAVCWNAGTRCESGASGQECWAENYTLDGTVVPDGLDAWANAVLHPVSKYEVQLMNLQASKTTGEVRVMVLGGARPDGTFVYDSGVDPTYEESFGIGPGCEVMIDGETEQAVPPVRLRALAEATEGRVYSICQPDFTQTMIELADELVP